MSYVRDPYDTDEPPCFCAPVDTDPLGATAEFCPMCGDPAKPFPLPEYDEPGVAYGEPPAGCSCSCHDETHSPICMTCCDVEDGTPRHLRDPEGDEAAHG